MRNLDGLPTDELRQAVRQIIGMRHRRAVDKHGNHRDVATEGGLDLDADKVVGIVEAAVVLELALETQCFPITARRASHLPTRSERTSTKSRPGGIVSTSKKTFSRPRRLVKAIVDSPRESRRNPHADS